MGFTQESMGFEIGLHLFGRPTNFYWGSQRKRTAHERHRLTSSNLAL